MSVSDCVSFAFTVDMVMESYMTYISFNNLIYHLFYKVKKLQNIIACSRIAEQNFYEKPNFFALHVCGTMVSNCLRGGGGGT